MVFTTITEAGAIAQRTMEEDEEKANMEREMLEVVTYIENEGDMNEIAFDMIEIAFEEELLNQGMFIDEEIGNEVYFDPIRMYFCETLSSTLYATNTNIEKRYDEMFPKLC